MTNNDELALKLKVAAEVIATEHYTDDQWFHYLRLAHHSNILALLAERDADKKRIEMLEKYVDERDAQNQDLLLNIGSLQQRIAELEARTVSVPTFEDYQPHIARELQGAFRLACAAAGINLEVGE